MDSGKLFQLTSFRWLLCLIMAIVLLTALMPQAQGYNMAAAAEDISVPGGPVGPVDIRIVRPEGSTGPLPIIMYYHGGGWEAGDKNSYDSLVREIARKANAAVVFVEYSLSPAVKYPVAIEEGYQAMKYIAENGRQLDLDPSRLAVVGDSAGGNMAAVMTLLAKERNGPKIAYQVLVYPVTDANFDTPSYQEFATGYNLDRDEMKLIWDNYLPDKAARKQPTASPLRASLDQLKGLPPALVVTAENDVLRDEGEAYAHKLAEAGVPVKNTRYPGATHGFIMDHDLAHNTATRDALNEACEALHSAFYK
jgi:acetyl esterase